MSQPKHSPFRYFEMRRTGLNNTQIAEALGVSEASVRRGLAKIREEVGLRMLFVDIETAPTLALIWRVYKENVSPDQIIEATEVISWSAKWAGEENVQFASVFHNGKEQMVQLIWDLLDQADVVIHWNGRRFDIPHLNREFLEAGRKPPAPYKQIDLMQAVKSQFRFITNKLAHVSVELGLAGKKEHEGFPLWLKCMEGDADAWERMREYNIQDTRLLEDVYTKLLPWIPNHPSLAAYTGKQDICTRCGSDDLARDGFQVTTAGRYPRFVCNSCGSYVRGNKRESGTNVIGVNV